MDNFVSQPDGQQKVKMVGLTLGKNCTTFHNEVYIQFISIISKICRCFDQEQNFNNIKNTFQFHQWI